MIYVHPTRSSIDLLLLNYKFHVIQHNCIQHFVEEWRAKIKLKEQCLLVTKYKLELEMLSVLNNGATFNIWIKTCLGQNEL